MKMSKPNSCKKIKVKNLRSRLKARLRGLRDDESGVSAIEFAIVALVLVATYIGLYEVSLAYEANGAISNSSDVTASFPTFYDDIKANDLSAIFTAAGAVASFTGVDKTKLTIRMFSVENLAGTRTIISKAQYIGSTAENPTSDVDQNYIDDLKINLADGQGLIISEVTYDYTPLISSQNLKPFTMRDIKIYNPRQNQGASLPFTDDTGATLASLSCSYSAGAINCT